MKRISFLFILIMLVSFAESCSIMKDMDSENRIDQATLNEAVESGRFIVKFDKMFTDFGNLIYLRPRSNYIIVDGKKAIISAAYAGRQYDFKLIEGIRMNGKAIEYKVKKDSKGRYYIRMEVGNSQNSFNIHLNISKNGYASVLVNSIRIDGSRYSGYVVPLDKKQADNEEPGTES